MKYVCFATTLDWDPVANEYSRPSIYLEWNSLVFAHVGSLLAVALFLHPLGNIYSESDDFEEGRK